MKTLKKFSLLIFISALFLTGCSKSDDIVTNPGESNRSPTTPSSPTPSNGATGLTGNVTVTWQCTDPDANDTLRYEVRTGLTSNPSTVVGTNLINRAFDIGVAGPDVTIYWKVTAKDNHGATTTGPVWSYRTAP